MSIRLDLLGYLDPRKHPFVVLNAAWDSYAAFKILKRHGQIDILSKLDLQILYVRHAKFNQYPSDSSESILPDYYEIGRGFSLLLLRQLAANIKYGLSIDEIYKISQELFSSINSIKIAEMIASSSIALNYMPTEFKLIIGPTAFFAKEKIDYFCTKYKHDEIGWISRIARQKNDI